jgi:hypothetical protein
MNTVRLSRLYVVLCLAACGTDAANGVQSADAGMTMAPDGQATDRDAGNGAPQDSGGLPACVRMPRSADADRFIVVAHPFKSDGSKDKRYEVLKLSSDGVVTKTGKTFTMGNGFEGRVQFTVDGAVGMVPQSDGSIGIFTLALDGTPTVVQAAFKSGFYAQALHINSAGTRAFILDTQVVKNGGGLYEFAIGCDGAPGTPKKLTEAENVGSLAPMAAQDSFLSSAGLTFGLPSADTHVFALPASANTVMTASGKLFTESTLVTDIGISKDEKLAVFACGNDLVGGGQVVAASINGSAITKRNTLAIAAASSIVSSPYGNAFLLTTADPDAVYVLAYESTSTSAPLINRGLVPYKFGRPQLPTSSVVISRGKLEGRVLIAETSAVRQMQFLPNGTIVDTATFTFTGDTSDAVGSIGVTP